MEIPFYNFSKLHPPEFREEINKRIQKIIFESNFVEGEFNFKFEEEFAKLQESHHCLLVGNGTDALEISLSAYGIKAGDKVGVPGITFFATAEAVINMGGVPVFIDVEPDTGLMSFDSLKRVHKKAALKAVIPVHIYGLPANMNEINNFCWENEILVVEDAAQAQGSFYEKDKAVGNGPNLTTFSFYPTKNLSAFGDAGAILTKDQRLADKIRSLRNHGRDEVGVVGRNSRCDHIQAAVLHLKLTNIAAYNQKRKDVAKYYFESLKEKNSFKMIPESYLNLSSWHLFPIILNNPAKRMEFNGYLKARGIPVAVFYDKALSEEKALIQYRTSPGEWENAEEFSKKVVCLPIGPFLTREEVQYISQEVMGFFEKALPNRAKNRSEIRLNP